MNESGAAVFTRRADAPTECERVCGYSASIPTESFAAGRYLVKFTVNAGKNSSVAESSFTILK